MGAEPTSIERFELEQQVGAGGMGVVFRARDRQTGAVVALKLLESEDAQAAARFKVESSVLSQLDHPGIVRYVAHGATESGRPYLAMEWLEGEDLRERLRRGVLDAAEALAMGARIADALAYTHARGVLHRDLKPSNIFLPHGRAVEPRIIDFGLARMVGESTRLTRGGARLGTAAYMSPEQVRGESNIDPRTDLFALGVVLFECLAGRLPHEGARAMAIMAKRLLEDAPRLSNWRPDLPAAVADLIAELLVRDRTMRPGDAAQLATALAALSEGRNPPLRVTSTLAPAALTTDESRLVCVVLSAAPDTPPSAPDQATVADESTGLTASSDDGPLVERIAELAIRHGARMEPLVNGSFASVLTGTGAATDLCVRGARYALGLREVVEDSRLAMTVGAAVLSRPLALDTIIETVAQLVGEPASGGTSAGVRIDDTAAGLLGTRFEVTRDAHGALLIGERTGDEGARKLLGRRTPFVGRASELRELRAAIAQATSQSAARAILVTGPAGIGKSRLVAELLRAHDDESAPVWLGRGDPLRQATPFGLLAPAIRNAAGIGDAASPADARGRLEVLVAPVEVRERGRVAEFVGELCGLPIPRAPSAQLRAARGSPLLHADQVQRAFEDLVLAITRAHPLLLVLEDLHFGDAPSLKLADAALRVAHDRPLVVLATARPEILEQGALPFAERELTHVRLGELGRRASARLVSAVLGESADAAQIERLARLGAGNALYLEELIRAAANGQQADLPGTVKAMAMARLAALAVDERRLLRAGAVFGESFWPDGAARLLGGEWPGLTAQLERLCEREWLSAVASEGSPEPLYRFRHDVLREAAYATLTDTDRRLGHRLAGEWLERHGERDAAALAIHFERGGESARAARHYGRAAQQALAASDMAAALARATDAKRCGVRGEPLGEVSLVEAVAHHWLAAHEAEHFAALQALRLLPPLSAPWYGAVEEMAEASLPLGDVDTLVELADALEEAPAELDASEATRTAFRTAAATLTMQLALAGRRDPAEVLMARLEASLETGVAPPLARARADFARAALATIAGDLGGLIAHARTAIAAFEEAGDLRAAALMRTNLAWGFAEIGAWSEAEQPLRAAAAVADRMGLSFVLGGVKNNLGLVLARQGQLPEALAAETESVTFYRQVGNQRLEGLSRIYLAMIHGLGGTLDEAEREARAAVAILAQMPPTRAHALATLAQVLLARGQTAEAHAIAAEASALLEQLGGIDEGETLVRLVRAETLALAGDEPAARAASARAREQLLSRAERIREPAWRESFLTRVPENARTLALAARWQA